MGGFPDDATLEALFEAARHTRSQALRFDPEAPGGFRVLTAEEDRELIDALRLPAQRYTADREHLLDERVGLLRRVAVRPRGRRDRLEGRRAEVGRRRVELGVVAGEVPEDPQLLVVEVDLAGLDIEEMRAVHPGILPEVHDVLGVDNSVASRASYGGTAPAQ